MERQDRINYVEFPAKDIEAAKIFFSKVFGWSFVDYGSEYSAFKNAGIDGGFFKSKLVVKANKGSALIVLYSKDLEATKNSIIENGGSISHPVFPFPGGQRFHFNDPNGNEYAVWSDAG